MERDVLPHRPRLTASVTVHGGTVTGSERIVIIRADEEAQYGAVMAAMDQLRQAGIEDIGLITEPAKGAIGAGGGQ